MHDRDCAAARLRTLTAAPVSGAGGDVATSLYGVGAPPRRRRHRGGSDAGEVSSTTTGRQQADMQTGQRSTADCRQASSTTSSDGGVARATDTSFSSDGLMTSPHPAPTTSASCTMPPELVTDCSLATNHAGIQGPGSKPLCG